VGEVRAIVARGLQGRLADTMARMATGRPSHWTREEREREERARTVRSHRDRDRTPEQRLEETLRISRLMSELRQGVARDVPAR
jgi:hypothetical protein